MIRINYLIRRPDAVGLDISPTGHFQPGSVLTIILGDDDAVRNDRAVLFAEVILPESYLDCRAASADFGRNHLRGGLRRCQDRHSLLPNGLRTKADLRLRLNSEDVRLAWYKRLDDTAELVRSEVLRLSVGRALVKYSNISYNKYWQYSKLYIVYRNSITLNAIRYSLNKIKKERKRRQRKV